MNKDVAEGICEVLGPVSQPTNNSVIEGGNFMHARVSLDASLPLCSGRVVSLGDDHQLWVSFKYKCLPNICYWCGCLDHNDKDCDIWIESEGTLSTDLQQFGPNIRASAIMASRKQVVSMPGYCKTKVGTSKAAFSGGTSGHTAMEQDSSPPPTVLSLEKETVILGKGC